MSAYYARMAEVAVVPSGAEASLVFDMPPSFVPQRFCVPDRCRSFMIVDIEKDGSSDLFRLFLDPDADGIAAEVYACSPDHESQAFDPIFCDRTPVRSVVVVARNLGEEAAELRGVLEGHVALLSVPPSPADP